MQPAPSLSPGLRCGYSCRLRWGQDRWLLSLGHPEAQALHIFVQLSFFGQYTQKTELETTQRLERGQPALKLFLPGSSVTHNLLFSNPSCISELSDLFAAFHRCNRMASCPGEWFSRSVPTYRPRTVQSRWGCFFLPSWFLQRRRGTPGSCPVPRWFRWYDGRRTPLSRKVPSCLEATAAGISKPQSTALVENGPKILFFISPPYSHGLKHKHPGMLLILSNMVLKLFRLEWERLEVCCEKEILCPKSL